MFKHFKFKSFCYICILVLISTPVNINAEKRIEVLVNGNEVAFDVSPEKINGRVMVPIRGIFEELGVSVKYDGSSKTITCTKDTTLIILKLDSKEVSVNGNIKMIDVPATLINNRTLVPVRFISESIGAEVNWDDDNSIVNVKLNNYSVRFNNLTNEKINEAINEGKKGVQYVLDLEKQYYIEANPSEYNIFIDKLQILTPYYLIMRNSALKSYKYEEYPFEDAKKLVEVSSIGDAISFEIIYNCSKIDSHKNIVAVIKQNGQIIKPYTFSGKEDLAKMTNNWPEFPDYQAYLYMSFNNTLSDKKIDYNKKAQLVISHAPGLESVYDIDFTKYQ